MLLIYGVLLALISGAFSFKVSVAASLTVGDTATVSWERDLLDPSDFNLVLRQTQPANGDVDTKSVDNRLVGGDRNGQVQFTLNKAGTFIVEARREQGNHVLASSSNLVVKDKDAAKAPGPADPPPPPPPPETTQPQDPPDPPPKTTPKDQPDPAPTTPKDPAPTSVTPSVAAATKSTTRSSSSTQSVSTVFTSVFRTAGTSITGSQATPGPTSPAAGSQPSSADAADFSSDKTLPSSLAVPSPVGGVSSSSTTKSKTPMIVGIVIGTLVFISLVALLLFCRCRTKRRTTSFYKDVIVRRYAASVPRFSMVFPGAAPGHTDSMATIPSTRSVTPDLEKSAPSAMFADYIHRDDGGSRHQAYLAPHSYSQFSYQTTGRSGGAGTDSSDFSPPFQQYSLPKAVAAPASPPSAPSHLMVPSSFASVAPASFSSPPQSYASSALGGSVLGLAGTRTERQMEIHDKIVDLQGRLISMCQWSGDGGESQEIAELKRSIGVLEAMMTSPWALGQTDEAPRGFLQ